MHTATSVPDRVELKVVGGTPVLGNVWRKVPNGVWQSRLALGGLQAVLAG